MRLRDVLPAELFEEFSDTKAFKLRDALVLKKCVAFDFFTSGEYAKIEVPIEYSMIWPGKEKFVHVFYEIEGGYLVGWNENPSRGWSFPVIKVK